MTRSLLAPVLVALAAPARGEQKSHRPSDVPAASPELSPPCAEAAPLQLQRRLRDERAHQTHLLVGGVATLGFFYASDAMLAFSSGLANDVSCAVVAKLETAPDGSPAPCVAPASRRLYIPVAGPFLYLADPNRSRDFGANTVALFTGLGQIAGLGLALYGGGHLLGLPDAPMTAQGGGAHASLEFLPSAPGAIAGGTFQLRM